MPLHQLLSAILPLPAAVGGMVGAALILMHVIPATVSTPVKVAAFITGVIAGLIGGGVLPLLILRHLVPARCPACRGRCPPASLGSLQDYLCRDCGQPHHSLFNPVNMICGLLGAIMGLTAVVISVATEGIETGGRIGGIVVGLSIFFAGLLIMGAWGLLVRLLAGRLPWVTRVRWDMMLGGGVAMALGLFFIVLGFAGSVESMQEGRGPVVGAGLVFFFAGVAILLPLFFAGRTDTPAQAIVGSLLLTSFAAVPAFIFLRERQGIFFLSLAAVAVLAALGWFTVGRMILRRIRKKKGAPPA